MGVRSLRAIDRSEGGGQNKGGPQRKMLAARERKSVRGKKQNSRKGLLLRGANERLAGGGSSEKASGTMLIKWLVERRVPLGLKKGGGRKGGDGK